MAMVEIEGMFLGAEIKKSSFDGKEKTEVVLDLFQKDSTHYQKNVQLKSEDISLYTKFTEDYDFGSIVRVKALVNAYQNRAYYKLTELLN